MCAPVDLAAAADALERGVARLYASHFLATLRASALARLAAFPGIYDGERVRPGPVQFQWRGPRRNAQISYRLEVANDGGFSNILLTTNVAIGTRQTLDLTTLNGAPGLDRWWRIITLGANGETAADVPAARFRLAPDSPPQVVPPEVRPGPNGELIVHSLRAEARPSFGEVLSAKFESRNAEGVRVNGRDQMLLYSVPAWPEEDFTVAVRVSIEEMPKGRIGQIFSAWAAGMDDPLRLAVDNGFPGQRFFQQLYQIRELHGR